MRAAHKTALTLSLSKGAVPTIGFDKLSLSAAFATTATLNLAECTA